MYINAYLTRYVFSHRRLSPHMYLHFVCVWVCVPLSSNYICYILHVHAKMSSFPAVLSTATSNHAIQVQKPQGYIHTNRQTDRHACVHTCIHAYMHTCIHAYMHTCTLHPAPCTLHRVPRTVWHVPCTMYHVPCTIPYIRTHMHYITGTTVHLHYVTLHCATCHYISLHVITLQYISLHFVTFHYISLHDITCHYMTLHCMALDDSALSYSTILLIKSIYIIFHLHTYLPTYIHTCISAQTSMHNYRVD